MKRLRIGVLGCSEFAVRAMIPAIANVPDVELAGVASRSKPKAKTIAQRFGTKPYFSYQSLIESDADLIYIPLATGLHGEWVDQCLDGGKHILVEKPFVSDFNSASQIILKARNKNLLICENFLFPLHSQTQWIQEQIANGEIGKIKLFRTNFSIPPLKPDNFRYDKSLGGGALLDLGSYTIKSSRLFFAQGANLNLLHATLRVDNEKGIDVAGAITLQTASGAIAQLAFSFDSFYQCSWEFLGEKGKLVSTRAYTAPPNFSLVLRIERQNHVQKLTLSPDNHYINMISHLASSIRQGGPYAAFWDELEFQNTFLAKIQSGAVYL